MVRTFAILILAFAVSLDSFTVGFTYGLRKMHIPFKSLFIIAMCTAASLTVAMTIGHVIAKAFSPKLVESIGGVMLVFIGIWVIYQFLRSEKDKEKEILIHEKMIFDIKIKSLGSAIHILKRPMSADFDRSGTINGIEALFLGVALSLDAFAVGISAAMLGYSPFHLAMTITMMSSVFVLLGIKSGLIFSKYQWIQKLSFLPGLLLVFIGIWKILLM